MHTNEHESPDKLIETVIGSAYEVSNVLGCGFLEKVYEEALLRELVSRNVAVRKDVPFPITYKGFRIARYTADLVVEDQLIVELKCVDQFSSEHMAQCIYYLKASGIRFALLINFQHPKVEWKRVVFGF